MASSLDLSSESITSMGPIFVVSIPISSRSCASFELSTTIHAVETLWDVIFTICTGDGLTAALLESYEA